MDGLRAESPHQHRTHVHSVAQTFLSACFTTDRNVCGTILNITQGQRSPPICFYGLRCRVGRELRVRVGVRVRNQFPKLRRELCREPCRVFELRNRQSSRQSSRRRLRERDVSGFKSLALQEILWVLRVLGATPRPIASPGSATLGFDCDGWIAG